MEEKGGLLETSEWAEAWGVRRGGRRRQGREGLNSRRLVPAIISFYFPISRLGLRLLHNQALLRQIAGIRIPGRGSPALYGYLT
jgi:hypothetical protein